MFSERKIKRIILSGVACAAVVFVSSCATQFVDYNMDRLVDSEYHRSGVDFPRKDINYIEEYINGRFPEAVWIKTRTQTFNSYYYFTLDGGRIYYKSIEPGGDVPQWTLFKKTGLPHDFLTPGFGIPGRIVEISADADELVAVSEQGLFYHLLMDKGFSWDSWRWYRKKGWPNKTDLVMDEVVDGNKAWSLGRRNGHVLWYEDIGGNQHHYGTMGISTCYYLLDDGQEIRFSDTGVPSDFSHNILGPERGRFIAESISASASTVFLINSAGEMYTRLVDFDTIGSDPMFFKYTYDRSYRDERPGSDYGTNFNKWMLPAEDWKRQPPIKLEGRAALSPRITILQNGRGNESRELRVAGLNSRGRTGYYYKQLNDAHWRFREASLILTSFLDSSAAENGYGPRGKSMDRSYRGGVWADGRRLPEFRIDIDNFNILEGDCRMKIRLGSESLPVHVYPVEMWSYVKRKSPGRDGTPKLFMVTLDIPEERLEGLSPEFRSFAEQELLKYDLQLFSFAAEATMDYLYICPFRENSGDLEIILTSGEYDELNPELVRRYAGLDDDGIAERIYSEELVLDDAEKSDAAAIRQKISRNNEYLEALSARMKVLDSMERSSSITDFSYSIADTVLGVTGLYTIDYPKIYTLTRFGGAILGRTNETFSRLRSSRNAFYSQMVSHLERRLTAYTEYLSAAEEGRKPSETALSFRERVSDYWREAGLGKFAEGVCVISDREFSFKINNTELDYHPALYILLEEPGEYFLFEFSDMEEIISHAASAGPAASFRINGRVTRVFPGPETGDFLSGSILEGRGVSDIEFFYNGENILISDTEGRAVMTLRPAGGSTRF